MYFPLNKKISINSSSVEFLTNHKKETQIPLPPHPGSFGFIRKNHQHEGVDLYCEEGDEVYAIESGIILDIFPFTGPIASSPWWNDTWGILVKGENYTFNYGEIIPNSNLKIGDSIKERDLLGLVTPVLKTNKGRPMSMLHLEMYCQNTKKALTSWNLGEPKPGNLLDPTNLLLDLKNQLFLGAPTSSNKINSKL